MTICQFAIFAKSHVVHDRSFDLLGIHDRVNVLVKDANAVGWTTVPQTLYVSFIADNGHHVLTVAHRGSPFNYNTDIELRPEHGNAFLQWIEADFPVGVRGDDFINEYPVLLDGQPLSVAHLVSHTM